MKKTPVILIAGPTGTGKTEYSVKLAKKLNTEIISCDSMQIYKHMDIGTAKIKENEMQGIVHHMINIAEPTQNYNVCNYVHDSKIIIDTISEHNKIPLIVGGTGLYANSLLNGINFFESAPTDLQYRKKLNEIASEKGCQYLFELLKKTDEKSSLVIHPNNVKRVIRALEYHHITGKTISEHNEETKKSESPYLCCKIGFTRNRENLYERINKRVDLMIEEGLVDEVKELIKMGCSSENTSMQAIGYKEVVNYLENAITYDEMIDMLKQNSRRYAKRQMTWFKKDSDMHWINLDDAENSNNVLETCLDLINNTFRPKGSVK